MAVPVPGQFYIPVKFPAPQPQAGNAPQALLSNICTVPTNYPTQLEFPNDPFKSNIAWALCFWQAS
jgi:hypothetical protein